MAIDLPAGDVDTLGDLEASPQVVKSGRIRQYLAEHPTLAYVLRRFALYVFTLWVAITATFFFFRLIPGNPIEAYIQNLRSSYDENASTSTAVINHYKAVFGLDGSLLTQYWHYMKQLVLHQNFGPSLINYPETAQAVVLKALPWTIGLLASATVIAWILGTFFGALAGWRRNRPGSEAATWLAVGIGPIPFYFVGLVLVFLLAYQHPILPAEGPYGVGVKVGLNLAYIFSILYHSLLPALSIVVVSAFANLLFMRQQMVSALGDDYLTLAQAKGLSPGRVLTRYAMPNCYLPQITNLTITFGAIFGGNVLIEELFGYPGVGYLLVKAIQQLDLNTVMCVTAFAIFGVLTAVFLLDLLMPLLDPRIKYTR